jgi:hypothetical protein
MIRYITETKVYSTNNQTDTNANSVIFVNTGQDAVNVDGLILQPSQSFEITGNLNEILVKVYNFNFLTNTAPSLTIIYKRYLQIES